MELELVRIWRLELKTVVFAMLDLELVLESERYLILELVSVSHSCKAMESIGVLRLKLWSDSEKSRAEVNEGND